MNEHQDPSPPDRRLPWILWASDLQLQVVFWMALTVVVVAFAYGLIAESIVAFVLGGAAFVVMFLIFLEDWERDMDWMRDDR
jgi:hypothetical protein